LQNTLSDDNANTAQQLATNTLKPLQAELSVSQAKIKELHLRANSNLRLFRGIKPKLEEALKASWSSSSSTYDPFYNHQHNHHQPI